MEAAENLAVGEVIAVAGAAESGPEGGSYEDDLGAAGQKVGGFIEHGGVYDGFIVFGNKVVYPFCDDWVNHGFLYLKQVREGKEQLAQGAAVYRAVFFFELEVLLLGIGNKGVQDSVFYKFYCVVDEEVGIYGGPAFFFHL